MTTPFPALVDAYSKLLPDVSFSMVTSATSVTQLEAMQQGSAEVGTSRADVAYMAFAGQLDEHPAAFDQLRGIAVLPASITHVLVRPNSHLDSIAAFRGLRVGMGPRGSTSSRIGKLLLHAFGLGEGDVQGEFLPYDVAVDRLLQGKLDAAFVSGASDPSLFVMAAMRGGASLLDIVDPSIEQLREEYPFFKTALIPKGAYPSQNHSIHTVGVDGLLLCRLDLDEGLVYRLTKAYFEASLSLSSGTDFRPPVDLQRAPATPIPLHAGAARYYRERELRR